MNTITFKSNKFFYEKEKEGTKPNTIRQVLHNEPRYKELLNMIQTREYGTIKIVLADTEESFERQITDVSFYDDWFIISWKPLEVHTITPCYENDFKGISCLEKEDKGYEYYGFHSFYNGDRNNIDVRPGHAIWVKKDEAEQLYDIFTQKITLNLNDEEPQEFDDD
jgi:hypothetical protein